LAVIDSSVQGSDKKMISTIKDKQEVLAIIPARGGSKGLPRKNLAPIGGRPLIAYTIDVALKARSMSRVIVSTDNEEIADVSRQLGAEVPFIRPAKLANDRADPSDVVRHALEWVRLREYQPDAVITLFPTHPFRTVTMVNGLVKKILEGFHDVKTVKPVVLNRVPFFRMDAKNRLTPIPIQNNASGDRQEIFYRPYGLFSGFLSMGNAIRGLYYHRIQDPISLIDIDSEEDRKIADAVLRKGLFNFEGP
jgi:CMP-N-acetylneuraminic acid synthetase